MPFYDKGDVRIRYEEAGSGFPLGCRSVVNRERTGDHPGAAPAFRDPWPEERKDTAAIGWRGQISTR